MLEEMTDWVRKIVFGAWEAHKTQWGNKKSATYGLLLWGHLGPQLRNGLGDCSNALSFFTEFSNNLRSGLLNEEHPSIQVLSGCIGVLLLLLLHWIFRVGVGVICHLAFITLLVFSSALLIRLLTATIIQQTNTHEASARAKNSYKEGVQPSHALPA
jgi:hypothetical protein